MIYVRTLTEREIDSIISDLSVVQTSPRAYDLLKWAASKLDFTKVSTQQDLTRWLYGVVRKESERMGVSPREYARRFKGMVKFFTDPRLGLSAVQEIQNEVAEEMAYDIRLAYSSATDLEDLQRTYVKYKDLEPPPLADNRLKQEVKNELNKLKAVIARVVSHPLYRHILSVLRDAQTLAKGENYKKASAVRLRGVIARLKAAKDIAKDIKKALNLPFTVNVKTIDRYARLFERELEARPIRPRRRLRLLRKRFGLL